MNLRGMFPRLTLDPEDLLAFVGEAVVPVTIEAIDYKTDRASGLGEAKIDYFVKFRELKRPVRLKKTSGEQIAAILGTSETDDWIGMVVGIRPAQILVPDPAGGQKPVWVINFYRVPEGATPRLPPKTDLSGYEDWHPRDQDRLRAAMGLLPPGPGGVGQDADSAPMGAETAAKIVVTLKRRGKAWDDLVSHCKDVGAGALIDGRLPPDCPIKLVPIARAFAAQHPQSDAVIDEAAETARLMAAWVPPAATRVDGDVVDVKTGEVIDDPDIPF